MYPELKTMLTRIADGRHPEFDWPTRANHITDVSFVGIRGRKWSVESRVIHPPRIGEHIGWLTFGKEGLLVRTSYYEVVQQVQWDIRDRYQYRYRPGEEAECYLTVFVKPMKKSIGELYDRLRDADERAKQKRRAKALARRSARRTQASARNRADPT